MLKGLDELRRDFGDVGLRERLDSSGFFACDFHGWILF